MLLEQLLSAVEVEAARETLGSSARGGCIRRGPLRDVTAGVEGEKSLYSPKKFHVTGVKDNSLQPFGLLVQVKATPRKLTVVSPAESTEDALFYPVAS